jgi:hypothetical protein
MRHRSMGVDLSRTERTARRSWLRSAPPLGGLFCAATAVMLACANNSSSEPSEPTAAGNDYPGPSNDRPGSGNDYAGASNDFPAPSNDYPGPSNDYPPRAGPAPQGSAASSGGPAPTSSGAPAAANCPVCTTYYCNAVPFAEPSGSPSDYSSRLSTSSLAGGGCSLLVPDAGPFEGICSFYGFCELTCGGGGQDNWTWTPVTLPAPLAAAGISLCFSGYATAPDAGVQCVYCAPCAAIASSSPGSVQCP